MRLSFTPAKEGKSDFDAQYRLRPVLYGQSHNLLFPIDCRSGRYCDIYGIMSVLGAK